MDLEDVLAKKRENLQKLIQKEDEAIRREMLKYEEAEFYIRLQSECFHLYPVVAKALSLLIADDKRRSIFCCILKGHKLEKLAAFHSLTPEEVVREFCSIVRELQRRVNEGAFTAKESVNIRLLHERNELRCKVRTCNARCEKLQLANMSLLQQITQLWDEKEKILRDEANSKLEREQGMRTDIRPKLPKEMEERKEEQATKPSNSIFNIARWIHWFKMACLRLYTNVPRQLLII